MLCGTYIGLKVLLSGGGRGRSGEFRQCRRRANLGREQHVAPHRRASEFYQSVTGLCGNWQGDACVRDKMSGQYDNPQLPHLLDSFAAIFPIKGPLNVARPSQGYPLIVQSGSSRAGAIWRCKPLRWCSLSGPPWPAPRTFTST